jgi:predicted dehydrogenase
VLVDGGSADVLWLCELDRGRLAQVGRRYPGVPLTTDLEDVLADPAVDAVLLATPVFTHYELGRRCLEAGKHAFIEKPLAASAPEATQLTELAAKRHLVLMCGHTFLYSPPVRMVREMIAGGELGELFFISSSRVNLGLHQRDASVVWDLGPHDFSILLDWLGELPRTIRATGRDSILPGITDVAFVTMEFPSGVIASMELSWLAPSKLRRTVVTGSKRMVVYEDGAREAIKIYDNGVDLKEPETFGEWQLSYRTGDVISPKLASDEPLSLQIGDFVDTITSGERRDRSLALAVDVVRLAEAAEASLERRGETVRVDEFDPLPRMAT